MSIRTDLALERHEIAGGGAIEGVKVSESKTEKTKTTVMDIETEQGAIAVGKPVGKYITVELASFSEDADITDERLEAVTNAVKSLIPEQGAVLVAGIGNRSITPDALGPSVASRIFATRHIDEKLQDTLGLGRLRPVSGFAAGVLGQTGMETAEVLCALIHAVNPSAVITVDALASRRLSRLGCTVQLSNTGISPGSGVGNSRVQIDAQSMGVPVIAIGVPTVVDAYTLAKDIAGETADIESPCENMMVTPKEIDVVIERAAQLLALAINLALQPSLSAEDITALTC